MIKKISKREAKRVDWIIDRVVVARASIDLAVEELHTLFGIHRSDAMQLVDGSDRGSDVLETLGVSVSDSEEETGPVSREWCDPLEQGES